MVGCVCDAGDVVVRVLILGEGKSGTTALLASVSAQLPRATEVFEPRNLHDVDLSPDPLVIKKLFQTWDPKEEPLLESFDKCVYIIRDPRDRLISHLLYDAYNKAARLDESKRQKWLSLLESKVHRPSEIPLIHLLNSWWRLSRTDLLSYYVRTSDRAIGFAGETQKRFHTVTYEQYVDTDLEGLSTYLDLELRPAVLRGSAKRVERRGTHGDWRSWFTPTDVKVFRPLTHQWLKVHGYDQRDWELTDREQLDHKTTVDYVSSLFDRKPV